MQGLERKPGVIGYSSLKVKQTYSASNVFAPSDYAYEMIHGTPVTLGQNDIHGTCLVVMAFNAGNVKSMRDKGIVRPVDNQAPYDLYCELGGMPQDEGLQPDILLNYWRANPINGYRLDAIAALATNDTISIRETVREFGFCLTTATLSQAQLGQQIWQVVPGSPLAGGHAFLTTGFIGGYANDDTWGMQRKYDWNFLAVQGQEVWRAELVEA